MRNAPLIQAAAFALLGGLAAAGCAHRADGTPSAEGTDPGKPPVAVSVSTAAPADLLQAVEVVGSLAPKVTADVKSEVTGIIEAVNVTEWVPVRKNEELARLGTEETRAAVDALRAVAAQARVAEARARREYERALQLQQFGLVTPQALDDAKDAVDAAAAGTQAAEAQVRTAEARLAKLSIRSPMDGVVAQRFVNVGDRVENMGGSTPMFRIVDNRLLELTVTVAARQLAAVRLGQAMEFTTDFAGDRVFTGKVMFINPTVDATNRAAKVVCDVPNPGGLLKGGLFVTGRIVTGRRADVLQVPREALLNWDLVEHRADVFVVANGAATRRTIRTGAVMPGAVEIASGLTAGDVVVTRGAFALRDGDRVLVAPAEPGA